MTNGDGTKCGCGKYRCVPVYPPPSAGHNRPDSCGHTIGGPRSDGRIGDLISPTPHPHHTDGTTACETNHRTVAEQIEWAHGRDKWKAAQKKLPDLATVLSVLYDHANPLSFDGHDNFKWVVENPEEAAICIHKMYSTIRGIAVGAKAMQEIPALGNSDD